MFEISGRIDAAALAFDATFETVADAIDTFDYASLVERLVDRDAQFVAADFPVDTVAIARPTLSADAVYTRLRLACGAARSAMVCI